MKLFAGLKLSLVKVHDVIVAWYYKMILGKDFFK